MFCVKVHVKQMSYVNSCPLLLNVSCHLLFDADMCLATAFCIDFSLLYFPVGALLGSSPCAWLPVGVWTGVSSLVKPAQHVDWPIQWLIAPSSPLYCSKPPYDSPSRRHDLLGWSTAGGATSCGATSCSEV